MHPATEIPDISVHPDRYGRLVKRSVQMLMFDDQETLAGFCILPVLDDHVWEDH